MLFSSKQKQIQSQLARYCQTVLECMEILHHGLAQYCENPDKENIRENFHKIHKAESLADDIRRDVEVLMYSKSLFPESRGDILGLLECADKVPNQAEASLRMIRNQNIIIPPPLTPEIMRLSEVCVRCVKTMVESIERLFTDYAGATIAVGKTDELETEADRLESDFIQHVFSGEHAAQIQPLNRILLRDLVKNIAGICDRAENVGDRIRIIVAKRGI